MILNKLTLTKTWNKWKSKGYVSDPMVHGISKSVAWQGKSTPEEILS